MLIRYGYEISHYVPAAEPLVACSRCTRERKRISAPRNRLHRARHRDATYLDLSATAAAGWVAPAGDLTLWGDATIEDDGTLDPSSPMRVRCRWPSCRTHVWFT